MKNKSNEEMSFGSVNTYNLKTDKENLLMLYDISTCVPFDRI